MYQPGQDIFIVGGPFRKNGAAATGLASSITVNVYLGTSLLLSAQPVSEIGDGMYQFSLAGAVTTSNGAGIYSFSFTCSNASAVDVVVLATIAEVGVGLAALAPTGDVNTANGFATVETISEIVNPVAPQSYYYGPSGVNSVDYDGSVGQPWQTLDYACSSIYGGIVPSLLIPLGATSQATAAPQAAFNVFANGYVGLVTSNTSFQISFAEGSSAVGWEPLLVGSTIYLRDRFATVLTSTLVSTDLYAITVGSTMNLPSPGDHWFAGIVFYPPNLSGAFNAAPADVTQVAGQTAEATAPVNFDLLATVSTAVANIASGSTKVAANIVQILGSAVTGTAAWLASAFSTFFNVNGSTLTTASVNQTGNAYPAAATAATNTSSLPAMISADQFTTNALANAPVASGSTIATAVWGDTATYTTGTKGAELASAGAATTPVTVIIPPPVQVIT